MKTRLAIGVASALREASTIDWPKMALSAPFVDLDGAVLWERSGHGQGIAVAAGVPGVRRS
jgi:hypothetical protein